MVNLHKFDVNIKGSIGVQEALTNIAVYCCFAVLKKMKCGFCKDQLICNEVEDLPHTLNYMVLEVVISYTLMRLLSI